MAKNIISVERNNNNLDLTEGTNKSPFLSLPIPQRQQRHVTQTQQATSIDVEEARRHLIEELAPTEPPSDASSISTQSEDETGDNTGEVNPSESETRSSSNPDEEQDILDTNTELYQAIVNSIMAYEDGDYVFGSDNTEDTAISITDEFGVISRYIQSLERYSKSSIHFGKSIINLHQLSMDLLSTDIFEGLDSDRRHQLIVKQLWNEVKQKVTWATFQKHIYRGRKLRSLFELHPAAIDGSRIQLSKVYDLNTSDILHLQKLIRKWLEERESKHAKVYLQKDNCQIYLTTSSWINIVEDRRLDSESVIKLLQFVSSKKIVDSSLYQQLCDSVDRNYNLTETDLDNGLFVPCCDNQHWWLIFYLDQSMFILNSRV